MTDSGEYKNKICRENIHIFKLELAEHNTRFIKTLKENQLTSDEVNNFHPLFSQNNLWQYGSIINVRNIHLEELFEAIFSYCQCESPLNPELVDQLINCFSTILTTLKEWSKMDSSEGNESGQDYIKDLFQNSILGIFKNILFNFGNSNSKKCLELSQIKMKNHILINLSKLLNGLICTANNMSLSLSSEVNDVLILMLLKMNELIIQEKHKMICITFYINVIEYFHQTFQDKVAIEFLHKILLHNKQLTSETKFSIIIFLFDHIDSYYLMKSKVGMNSFDQSKSTLAPIVTNNHKQEAENFLKHLKELSLAELTNVNQSVRKSALYVMKRIYQLECEDIPDMNYTWENFFHIFETLEETQVKLIVPVLENITSCDCLVLKKILLIRMFQYDNGTIVKAGIKSLHLLNNDPDIIVSLLSTLMKALNNSSLFVPEIEVVKTSLVTLFQLFNTPYTKEGLYQDFINSIITVAWGPVPLFFIIHYLELSSSDLKPLYLYDNNVLPILNSNFETVTKLLKLNFKHNPIIRSAIDSCLRKHISTCLVLPLRQMNIIVDNMELVSVLDHFLNACTPADDKDVTNIYGKLFKDLASSLVIDEEFMHQYMAERFIADSKVQESCFNMIALYFCNTSGSKKQEDFLFLVERKLKNDKSAESYENIFKIIKFGFKYTFLSPLIWCGVNLLNIEVKCCFLHSFLSMYYSEEQFSDNFKNLLEHRDLEIYGKYLEFLIENCSVVRVFLEKQLKDDSIDFLNQQFGIFKSEFNYLYTFNRFYNSYSCDEYFLLNEKHLNALFNKNNFFKCANRKSVKLKINMFLRLCQGRHERHEILVDLFIFSELCLEALSNTNRDCLNEILEIMELLMFFCSSEDYKEKRVQSNEIIKEFIKASFQEVKNTRRTTVFRSSMNAWIYSVISVLNDEVYHDVLMECVEEILEHEESSHCLFKRIHNLMCYSIRIRNQSNSCESFLLCLIAKGLVYGDLPKKDIVVERTVCDYIRQHKLGTQWHVKFHHSCHIRYKCTQAILYYIGVLKHEAWGMLLLDHLKQVFDSDQARVQYFHNSLTHRIKQRAIQNILLLDHILRNRRSKQDLFVWGLRNILNYNHQPSIRYFLEWLIIRNLDSAECTNQFWSHFDKAYDERPGSIVSFLCIVFHAVHRIVTSQGPYTQHQVRTVTINKLFLKPFMLFCNPYIYLCVMFELYFKGYKKSSFFIYYFKYHTTCSFQIISLKKCSC